MNKWIFIISAIAIGSLLVVLNFSSVYNYGTYVIPIQNAVLDKGIGHYDYLLDGGNMTSIEKATLQPDNSINVIFGQNDYKWSTGYEPIPEFDYEMNLQRNDTLVLLCTNIGKDGYADQHPDLSEPYFPGLGIFKYLGPIAFENKTVLLFWHESASLQVDMPCNYPEVIYNSINLWELEERGDPDNNLEKIFGSD